MTAQNIDSIEESSTERKQEERLTICLSQDWKKANGNTTASELVLDSMQTFQMQISDDTISIVPQNSCVAPRHNGKNPASVARRNARERRRIKNVNSAFDELRQHVPHGERNRKKISKVDTLQSAIEYIKALEELVQSRRRANGLFSGADTDKENFPETDFSVHPLYSDSENEENLPDDMRIAGEQQSLKIINQTNKAFEDLLCRTPSKRSCPDDFEGDNCKRICRTKTNRSTSAYDDNSESSPHSDSGFSDAFQNSSEDEVFSSFAPKTPEERRSRRAWLQADLASDGTATNMYCQSILQSPVQHSSMGAFERETVESITSEDINLLPSSNNLQTFESKSADAAKVPLGEAFLPLDDWSYSMNDDDLDSVEAENSNRETPRPNCESYVAEFLGENGAELRFPDIPQPYVPISIDQINPSIDFLPEREEFSSDVTSFSYFPANHNLDQPSCLSRDSSADLSLVLAQLN